MIWRHEDSNQSTSSVSSTGYQGKTKQDSWYDPIRMPINSLLSGRASRGMYHNKPYSRIRSILRLSKEIYWSQPQHMVVRTSWKEITCLDMMMIFRDYLNKNNISCTVFSTKCYKVTWAEPYSDNMHQLWMHNQY